MRAVQSLPETATPERAFHSLLRTLGLVRQVQEPYFARHGIRPSQWAVLRVLRKAETAGERGVRLTDLGERLLIRPPSVTCVVDRLVRSRLVERTASRADLRVRRVSLTARGRALVERLMEGHPERIRSLFANFAPRELAELDCLLGKMQENLHCLASAPPGDAAAATRRRPRNQE